VELSSSLIESSAETLSGKKTSLLEEAAVTSMKDGSIFLTLSGLYFNGDEDIVGVTFGGVRHDGWSRDCDMLDCVLEYFLESSDKELALLDGREKDCSWDNLIWDRVSWSIAWLRESVIEIMFESPKSAFSTERSRVGGESGISITLALVVF
jgi:hypothetical protein